MATLKMKDAQGRWVISEDPTAVKYIKSQTLTNSQRQIAQANMGISSTDNNFKNTVETIVNNMGLTPGTGGEGGEVAISKYLATFGTGNTQSWSYTTYCKIDPSWQYILLIRQAYSWYGYSDHETYGAPEIYGVLQKDWDGEYSFSLYGRNGLSWYLPFTIEENVYLTGWGETPDYELAIRYPDEWYGFIAIPLQAWHYCLREDTLIPMEDGSYKAIKDVQPREKVAFYNTFNHDPEMKYNVVCVPSVTSKPPKYRTFTFSNGSVLHIGGNHMLFNTEEDAIVGSDDWKVGMHGIGEDGKEIELISIEEKENTEGYTFYNMFTRHYRYLANGVLCGHSQAALGAEFAKYDNKKYHFKDKDYMSYLRRKHTEREIMTKGYMPLAMEGELRSIMREYQKYEDIEAENKQYLNDTDYKVVKYNSGLISKEEFEEAEKLREEARERIREARTHYAEREEKIKEAKLKHLDKISPVKGVW